MKILLIGNGADTKTTAILFRALAAKLAERHQVVLRSRPAAPSLTAKLVRLARLEPESLDAVRACDVLIVHSAAVISFQEIRLARALGKRVLIFLWDIYPDSANYVRRRIPRPAMPVFRAVENWCLRQADRVLVPSDDFLRPHSVARLSDVRVFPHWPATDHDLPPIVDRPESTVLRFAFSGQINELRDLDGACEKLAAAFDTPIELHVFSEDTFTPRASVRAPVLERLAVIHRGFLPQDALARAIADMDAGLISLAPDFPLPAFPSKLLTYMQSAIPVVYHGPTDTAFSTLLTTYGIGLPLAGLRTGAGEPALRSLLQEFGAGRDRFLDTVRLDWRRIDEILE